MDMETTSSILDGLKYWISSSFGFNRASMQRILTALEKKDPEMDTLVKELHFRADLLHNLFREGPHGLQPPCVDVV